MIGVWVDALDFFRVEIKRIGTDEKRGRGAALDGEGGADVLEFAAASVDFVAGLVSFDMLSKVIELNVAASDHNLRRTVIFDVVGAKTHVAAFDVDISVSGEDAAADVVLLVGFEGPVRAGGRH